MYARYSVRSVALDNHALPSITRVYQWRPEIMWDDLLYKYGIERLQLYSSSINSNTETVPEYTDDAMWLNVF